jgi:hypothetical protein
MTYFDQLHPWCLMRLLPNLQRQVIARFRRRNDAEAHMRVLRQQAPTVHYEVVFDGGGDRPVPSPDATLGQPGKVG